MRCNRVVVSELLPSLYMKRGEGLEGSLTCEKLEATLCVLNSPHAEEPDQEVEAVHKKCTYNRSLWKTHRCGYWIVRWIPTIVWYPRRQKQLPELLTLFPGELWNHRILPCCPNIHTLVISCFTLTQICETGEPIWMRPHRFRVEVVESSLHFLNVRKSCGSISICHQDDSSPGAHRPLHVWQEKNPQWTISIRLLLRPGPHTAVGHLWSYHSHSSSFPPVLHQCQDPNFVCTILPTVPQSNLVGHHNKSHYTLHLAFNQAKMKCGK